MRFPQSILLLILLASQAVSQSYRLEGRVQASDTQSPIAGAIVTISGARDSSSTVRTVTDAGGLFSFTSLSWGTYIIEVSHLAYAHYRKTIVLVEHPSVQLAIILTPRAIPLAEVLVRATPPTVQKADTTEYVADAFKINRDALAEDLLMKLPGVSVVDGVVKAGGDEVKQVLVDGRPFFGTDPMLALRNLPADAIEKVQVFERMSDQAEFTGFDDGQAVRTMNFITRESRRRSTFGRASAGYGERARYVLGGSGNLFNGPQRISLLGQSNNASQQGFSTQDILGDFGGGPPRGGGMRRGGGGPPGGGMGGPPPGEIGRPGGMLDLVGSMVGTQSGLSTVHAFGGNYSDLWQSDLNLAGSYFFNQSDNENTRTVSRDYTLTQEAGSRYSEINETTSGNVNHRINLRVEIPIDSVNSLLITPSASYQSTDAWSALDATTMYSGSARQSTVRSASQSSGSGYNIAQNLLWRHKFDLPGRTFSIDAGISGNDRERTADLHSAILAQSPVTNQRGENTVRGVTLSVRGAYTEPLAVNSQFQLEFTSSYNRGNSDTRTFNDDSLRATSDRLDSTLSNSFENHYWSQRAGVSYQYRSAQMRLTAGVGFDRAALEGNRTFPTTLKTERSFSSILPNIYVDYSPEIGMHLRVGYRASTQAPSINQLQDVVDNTNQLRLTGGNPDLQQAMVHTLSGRLLETEGDKAVSRMFMLSVAATSNYIANAIRTINNDTLLAGGVQAYRGSQLTAPTNLQGYWMARAAADFGFPVEFISSNINLNTSASLRRAPGQIDDVEYSTMTWTLGGGVALGTNVSREIDCHISYNGTSTTSRNTIYPDLTSSYFSHSVSLRSTLTFWDILVVRNEASYILRTGFSDGGSQSSLLWTANAGVKFLPQNRGELRLTINDVLNKNQSTSRTVTESYIEDATNRVLPRYLMLTFEYRWQ
jgi:hypothetical protein